MATLESRPSVAKINSEDNVIIAPVVAAVLLSAIAFLNHGQLHPALSIDTGKFSNSEPPALALPPTQREAEDAITIRETPVA